MQTGRTNTFALGLGAGLVAAAPIAALAFFIGTLSERTQQQAAQLERMGAESGRVVAQAAPPVAFPKVPAPPAPEAITDAAPAVDADGVPVRLGAILGVPAKAGQLSEALNRTFKITTEGGTVADRSIFAFFDPRCPYCKAAMGELAGEAKVTWIPVALLPEPDKSLPLIAAVQKAAESGNSKDAITSMSAGTLAPGEVTDELKARVGENAQVLLALYDGATDALGVPAILVQRPDGTIKMFHGFSKGDGAKILAAYRG